MQYAEHFTDQLAGEYEYWTHDIAAHHRQLIEDYILNYNAKINSGIIPVRYNKDGNKIVPQYAPPAHSGLREIDSHSISLLGSMPWIASYGIHHQLPGFIRYNKEDGTVSAYISLDDFLRNRPQRMKLGRYLRKTKNFTDDAVNEIANSVKSLVAAMDTARLDFAMGSDEIEYVYEHGPRSCMQGTDWDIHPTRVYGTPDLACAYVKIDGRIKARAMCNMINNEYSTIYGNSALLRPMLERAGFESGDLEGCRIKKICVDSYNEIYVMPYIDHEDEVGDGDDDDYFLIGDSGYCCDNTNGLSVEGSPCEHCGDLVLEEDSLYIGDVGAFCDHDCAESEGFVWVSCDEGGLDDFYRQDDCVFCETDQEWHYNDSNLITIDDEYYHQDDENIVYSEDQDAYLLRCDATYIESIHDWVDEDREDEFQEEDADAYA